MQAIKKAVKVSYQGETKRLKLSGVYQELIDRTRSAFKSLPSEFKFFYLDEDNEIISISSQSDYSEALDIEDFTALRLTVSKNASDARQQLVTQLEDARPLAESLNSSVIMSQHNGFGRSSTLPNNVFMAESDFDAVSHAELANSIVDRRTTMIDTMDRKPVHEMACGGDEIMNHGVSVGTGSTLRDTIESGCNTQRVMSSDAMVDTNVQMADSQSQAGVHVRDMGTDGILAQMQSQASQMEVQMKTVDVTCDLLIPSDDDMEGVEEVTCIKCNGTQMNKKGLPCRKCKGTGTLISRELSAVAAIVRQEVQEYCYSEFKKMFTEYLEQKTDEQDKTVHESVICDGCNMNPIIGVRYMCSVRSDTDYCQKCERTGQYNQHPLLKIRKTKQAPAKLICQYKRNDYPVMQPQMPTQSVDHPWERQAPVEAPKNVRYSARFVKESFPDKHEIICGDIFCKSWWMRNDGETSWPAGTQLLQTSGDDISAQVVTLRNEVPAGATFEISVQAKAPEQEGRYVAFFRVQTGTIKFGHKVSCDILCVKPAQVESDLMKPAFMAEPVQMVAQEAAAAQDKDSAEIEPVSDLLKSTISIDAKSPKDRYFEAVECETEQTMKDALKALYDFGFTQFSVNKSLMLKLKDVNIVAEQLMTGALSESQFGAMYN